MGDQFASEDCSGTVETSVTMTIPDFHALGSCDTECCCFVKSGTGGSQMNSECNSARMLQSSSSGPDTTDGALHNPCHRWRSQQLSVHSSTLQSERQAGALNDSPLAASG